MTLEKIKDRIKKIAESSFDDESAHAMEDKLYSDFIEYVSMLDNPLAKKAKEILKTKEFDFARWCA